MRAHILASSLGGALISVMAAPVWVATSLSAQTIRYVDNAAVGENDGTSWDDAFIDLHDALAVAVAQDEVWIAAGTYKPDRGSGDRTVAYLVPAGVTLFGGFAGFEECLDERDWVAHESILSGDLNGDDGPRDCAEVSDCCREHDAPGCDDPECNNLVCSSWPDCCMEGQPKLPSWEDYNCVRLARERCCHLGSWRSCENSINVVQLGEGDATTTLDGLVVERAYYSSARDWQTGGSEGAVRSTSGSLATPDLLVRNAVVRENTPWGIISPTGVVVEDCEFTSNLGGDVISLDLDMRRSRVHNSGRVGAYSSATIEDCLFQNTQGLGFWGGGTIRRSRFLSNWGSVNLGDGYFEVTDSLFTDEGTIVMSWSAALIEGCRFIGNTSTAIDGWLSVGWLRKNLFAGIRAVHSPVSFGPASQLEIENCTFYGNGDNLHPVPYAIAVYDVDSHANVRNCIFRGRPNDIHPPEYYLLLIQSGATMNISHSIVEGWTGRWGGVGNSGVDPLFVDPNGADDVIGTEDDDLRLSPDSPAINAGDPSDVPSVGETDLDGHPRVLCGRVDIGAYEFGIGDYDCNRIVDLTDFAAWQVCMTGPSASATAVAPNPVAPAPGSDSQSEMGNGKSAINCGAFDFNADGAVDLRDLRSFLNLLTNP